MARWGAARADHLQPLRSLVEAGIPLGLGSDGQLGPFVNLVSAVSDPENPAEGLSREQAVIAYTQGSTYAEFTEKDKGTLAVGKLADLAVLSQDVFQVPLADLPKTESVLTMVGGKIIYDVGLLPPAPERSSKLTSSRPEQSWLRPRA